MQTGLMPIGTAVTLFILIMILILICIIVTAILLVEYTSALFRNLETSLVDKVEDNLDANQDQIRCNMELAIRNPRSVECATTLSSNSEINNDVINHYCKYGINNNYI